MPRRPLSTAVRLGFAAVAVALPGCGGEPQEPAAPPAVYWAQGPTGTSSERGSIGRAGLDGSRVTRDFVAGTRGGAGVAVDDGHLYWANYAEGTIGRAKRDGSGVEPRFITGADDPVGVAVDARHVYWTNSGSGTIGRAELDGSDADQSFFRATREYSFDLTGMAVDSRYVYWADMSGRVGRARLDGTGVEPRFITGASRPTGVAVDGHHVYWSNSGYNSIGRANLDGSGVNQHCVAIPDVPIGTVPEGVAADGEHVYWSGYPANAIGRAKPDGTDVEARFIDVDGVPEGLAVARGEMRGPRSRPSRCARSKEPILLGRRNYAGGPYAQGWGEVAPVTISNGGASANGTMSRIRWSSWGGEVAEGRGRHPIYAPRGGYYPRPVVIQLRASLVKRCRPGGPRVYTRLMVREPDRPGGPVGPWHAWAPDMCARQP